MPQQLDNRAAQRLAYDDLADRLTAEQLAAVWRAVVIYGPHECMKRVLALVEDSDDPGFDSLAHALDYIAREICRELAESN